MASNSEEKLSMNTEEWTRERDEEDKEAFLLSKLQNSSGGLDSQIWSIFASSVFPQNSTILYESYQRAYARNDLEESSEYLGKLIENSIETQAVEFYVSCIFIPPTVHNDEIIKSLHLCRTDPLERWGPLLELLKAFSIRYKWTIPEKLKVYNKFRVDELVVWLKLRGNAFHSMILKKHAKLKDKQQREEVFLNICLAFFYHFHEIASYIYPQNKPYFFKGNVLISCWMEIQLVKKKCPENLGNELLLAGIR
ncbi:hypothetical protein CEXT_276891 [Caerostris extrusa]|uniref:Uncharacterized protein n=1 Tax=Caerostris extrusa TaxID=172846 RepID=A0AAV4WKG8_CAEEX|nr:hypothetical protein CEXT_276891 [Caerostris extrusa]